MTKHNISSIFLIFLLISTIILSVIRSVEAQNIEVYSESLTAISRITYNENNIIQKKDPEIKVVAFDSLKMPILMYHHIRDYNNSKDPIGTGLSVSPANFERNIKELIASGYTTISFNELIQHVQKGAPLPTKPIIISFDDGYDNNYINAYPIMKKYNQKGSFAIITGYVGNPGYMSWDNIKELKNNGNEIISHTVSHADLSTLSEESLKNQLGQSKKDLDTILGQNTETLIYPCGKYNQLVEKIALESGYKLARTTKYGTEITKNNLFELSTVRMTNSSSL
ncbi:MAG: polysaccharide deacetylase family protein [bacterium]